MALKAIAMQDGACWKVILDAETYAFDRWLMNTVALLLSARIALAWICVLGGSTPLARRVMIDLGRLRSCTHHIHTFPPN